LILVLFHDFILTAKIYNKNEITGDASAFFMEVSRNTTAKSQSFLTICAME